MVTMTCLYCDKIISAVSIEGSEATGAAVCDECWDHPDTDHHEDVLVEIGRWADAVQASGEGWCF